MNPDFIKMYLKSALEKGLEKGAKTGVRSVFEELADGLSIDQLTKLTEILQEALKRKTTPPKIKQVKT
jgi:hypothetical protein